LVEELLDILSRSKLVDRHVSDVVCTIPLVELKLLDYTAHIVD
jgi:hypothetical protein